MQAKFGKANFEITLQEITLQVIIGSRVEIIALASAMGRLDSARTQPHHGDGAEVDGEARGHGVHHAVDERSRRVLHLPSCSGTTCIWKSKP